METVRGRSGRTITASYGPGQLVTARGSTCALPLFLPVYQGNTGSIPLSPVVGEHQVHGCMVNAYFLYKQRELRTELEAHTALHQYLGFHGLVMTDSGAFQLLTRNILLSNKKIVRFQSRIGADIASPLDLITSPAEPYSTAEAKAEATFKRVREAQRHAGDSILAGVQQGGRFLDLRQRSTEQMLSLGVRYLAVGSLVPFFTRRHELTFVSTVLRHSRAQVGADLPIHVYGAGDPLELPLLAYWGADVFDSSSYIHYARGNWYMTPYGAIRDPAVIAAYPCRCPSCAERESAEKLLEDVGALSLHNLWTILDTVQAIGAARRTGLLGDLADDVVRRHVAWFPDSPLLRVWEQSQDG